MTDNTTAQSPDRALALGWMIYDFVMPDGDTLGTLIHQSEYIRSDQPLDAQLRDVRLICNNLAAHILTALAPVKEIPNLDKAIKWMESIHGPKDERLEPDYSRVQTVIEAARAYKDLMEKK